MNLSLFSSLYQNRKNFNGRNMSLSKLFGYFIKLMIGELTGSIYNKKIDSYTINKDELISSMKIIDNQIRKSLVRMKVENCIDIEKKEGFENIGSGCLITSIMFGKLMAVTQGKAQFYFPTKANEKYLLKISLLSIPKISGIIEFEDKPIHYFSISTLNSYNITIEVKPEYVTEVISKISISTNKHWSPKYLDKNLFDFPVGVIVRSIELLPTSFRS